MQLSLSQLEVLKPANWSPKCRQNTLIGVISMVALGAIVFLSSSQARAWLRFQFMTADSAGGHLQRAIEKNDPAIVKAILQTFSMSNEIQMRLEKAINFDNLKNAPELVGVILNSKARYTLLDGNLLLLSLLISLEGLCEVWSQSIDADGNTLLHVAMNNVSTSNNFKSVIDKLLECPNAQKLVKIQNKKGEYPLSAAYLNSCKGSRILSLMRNYDFPKNAWLPLRLGDEGNTVLHKLFKEIDLSDYIELTDVLTEKGLAMDLSRIANKEGEYALASSVMKDLYKNPLTLFRLITEYDFPAEIWKNSVHDHYNAHTALRYAISILIDRQVTEEWRGKWSKVVVALLSKPYAVGLLESMTEPLLESNDSLEHASTVFLGLVKNDSLSLDVLKFPVNKEGDTILHLSLKHLGKNKNWKEITLKLLNNPDVTDLLEVKNKAGLCPSLSGANGQQLLSLLEEDCIPFEVWKNPINDKGSTRLHDAMHKLRYRTVDIDLEIVCSFLSKDFAVKLLMIKNSDGKYPLSDLINEPEETLNIVKDENISVEVWKTPVDSKGNTLLHLAANKNYGDWRAVKELLINLPGADELKLIKNNAGEVPQLETDSDSD